MVNCFAENFTDILRVKGITQKEIANFINVRPSTVNQWAKGKREPEFDYLLRLCYHLDVSPNELLGYEKTKNYFAIEQIMVDTIKDFKSKPIKEQKDIVNSYNQDIE